MYQNKLNAGGLTLEYLFDIAKDIQEQSNGESDLMYFSSYITDNGLFILDEPENSMSASMQIKLAKFIEDSARFFDSQFIIATHSPFLLSIKDALIYDLDSVPTITKKWTDLENMQVYYDFFKNNSLDFEKKHNFTEFSLFYHFFFLKCMVLLFTEDEVKNVFLFIDH